MDVDAEELPAALRVRLVLQVIGGVFVIWRERVGGSFLAVHEGYGETAIES
jgi:hypothetical protein